MAYLRRLAVQGSWRIRRLNWPFNWLFYIMSFVIMCSLMARFRSHEPENEILFINDVSVKDASNVESTSQKNDVSSGGQPPLLSEQKTSEKPHNFAIKEPKISERKSSTDKNLINSNVIENQNFGFVNKSFHVTEKPNSLINTFIKDPEKFGKQFKETPIGQSIGSILEAGASLKKVFGDKKINDKEIKLNPVVKKPEKIEILDVVDHSDPKKKSTTSEIENNVHPKEAKSSTQPVKDVGKGHIINQSLGKKSQPGIKDDGQYQYFEGIRNNDKSIGYKDSRDNGYKKPAYKSNKEGSLMSNIMNQVGPALISSAIMGSFGNNQENNNPLMSIAKNVLPSLVGGIKDNNDGSSSMVSLISGVGQIANHFIQNGESTKENNAPRNRENSRFEERKMPSMMDTFQNIAGNMGPALLSAALTQQEGSSGLLGNLMPLMQTFMQPKQSSRNNRFTKRDNSQKDQTIKNNIQEGVIKNELDVKPSDTKDGKSNPYKSNSNAVNSLAGIALNGLAKYIPTALGADEEPFSKGILNGMFQYALGDPTDSNNKHVQMFNLLRQGVQDTSKNKGIDRRLKMSLELPLREKHRDEIVSFYKAITTTNPVCNKIDSIGGVYKWKEDIVEKKQMMCSDMDVNPLNQDCVVLSFGIRNEWSFEEKVQDLGCKVWSFDPSMQTGNHNHTEKIQFYNIGLDSTNRTLHIKEQVWSLFTYSAILSHLRLTYTPITYLKIDLPAWEWKIIDEILDHSPDLLSRVSQLGLTVHLNNAILNPDIYYSFNSILGKLYSFGFQLFATQPDLHPTKTFVDPLYPGKNLSIEYKLTFLRV